MQIEYHAAKFFFRHLDIFDTGIALSGLNRLNHSFFDKLELPVYGPR